MHSCAERAETRHCARVCLSNSRVGACTLHLQYAHMHQPSWPLCHHLRAGCRPGQYWEDNPVPAGPGKCVDCPLGAFCPGGVHDTANDPQQEIFRFECGPGLTTRTKRSQASSACVNMPGFRYVPAAGSATRPSAEKCRVGTYSPGLSKQLACTACPPGFTTPKLQTGPKDCGAALVLAQSDTHACHLYVGVCLAVCMR